MQLQSNLDPFKARFESGAPAKVDANVGEILRRSVNDLNALGVVEMALKVGDIAPDFSLEDVRGVRFSSRVLRRRGPLVVVFHRGLWRPHSNMELQALQHVLPKIRKRGAGLVAISPQVAESNCRTQAGHSLTVPLLVDPQNETAAAYGIRWKQYDYLVDLYRTIFGVDLEASNGEGCWALPMPARFVIGDGGRVFYADVSVDHTQRPELENLIAAIDAARDAAL